MTTYPDALERERKTNDSMEATSFSTFLHSRAAARTALRPSILQYRAKGNSGKYGIDVIISINPLNPPSFPAEHVTKPLFPATTIINPSESDLTRGDLIKRQKPEKKSLHLHLRCILCPVLPVQNAHLNHYLVNRPCVNACWPDKCARLQRG